MNNRHWIVAVIMGGLVAAASSVWAQEEAPVFGTHYFIDQDHADAADDNPGTEDKPLKTITGGIRALATVIRPGDTLYIKDGLYRGIDVRLDSSPRHNSIVFPSGKSYSRMISIQAYPGHQPVINAAAIVTGWQLHRDEIWTASYEGDTRHIFPITFVDGKPLQQIGGTVRRDAEHWRGKKGETLDDLEPGSFYFDEEQRTLYVWLPDGSDPNQRLMETFQPSRFGLGAGMQFIRFSGLTLRYTGIGLQGANHILEDIDQAWGPRQGCGMYGHDHTVMNSRFNHNGNSGMVGNGRGFRIIDCETNYNNWRLWSSGWGAGGTKFIPYLHDTVIRGHVAIGNIESPGIWCDAFMSNVTIEGCIARGNGTAGIMYEIGKGGVIKNNIVYENGHRGIYISNSSHTIVAHNVVYRNGMSGIAVIGVNRGGGHFGRGAGNYMPGGHNVVWGNILVDNCWDDSRDLERFAGWGGRGELIMPHDREGNEGNVSDYNVFWRTGARGGDALNRLSFMRGFDTSFARGIEDWREKTGWDPNSIVADPMFANEAEYDFRLATGSPALWIVTQLEAAMAFDFDGKRRPRMLHSAGPFEGDERELAKIQSDPPAGPHRLYPLKYKTGQPLGESINMARYARGMLRGEFAADFGFGLTGVRVLDIPFLRGSLDFIVLDSACREATMTLGGEVKRLHLLLSFVKARPDHPFAKATITRGDGMTIDLVWSVDKDGHPQAAPTDATDTVLGHTGTNRNFQTLVSEDEMSVYITSWNNDNEWYPLDQIEFTLLDEAAQVFFLGVTGDRLE